MYPLWPISGQILVMRDTHASREGILGGHEGQVEDPEGFFPQALNLEPLRYSRLPLCSLT
jgi:hypothetical protein